MKRKTITVKKPTQEETEKKKARENKNIQESVKQTRQNINAARGISQEIRGWLTAARALRR